VAETGTRAPGGVHNDLKQGERFLPAAQSVLQSNDALYVMTVGICHNRGYAPGAEAVDCFERSDERPVRWYDYATCVLQRQRKFAGAGWRTRSICCTTERDGYRIDDVTCPIFWVTITFNPIIHFVKPQSIQQGRRGPKPVSFFFAIMVRYWRYKDASFKKRVCKRVDSALATCHIKPLLNHLPQRQS
jgi:hypothetical protein